MTKAFHSRLCNCQSYTHNFTPIPATRGTLAPEVYLLHAIHGAGRSMDRRRTYPWRSTPFMGALHPFRRRKDPHSGLSLHGISFAVRGVDFRFLKRALCMVALPRFRHTLIRVFRMNNDDIGAAAGSADHPPPHHIMVPINPFKSEARNAVQLLMLDANKDTSHEQVSL